MRRAWWDYVILPECKAAIDKAVAREAQAAGLVVRPEYEDL